MAIQNYTSINRAVYTPSYSAHSTGYLPLLKQNLTDYVQPERTYTMSSISGEKLEYKDIAGACTVFI